MGSEAWPKFARSWRGTSDDKHFNENSGSIKCRECLDQVSDCQLLKKEFFSV
jgi:hypothetical protein